jgi:hypothetical protein
MHGLKRQVVRSYTNRKDIFFLNNQKQIACVVLLLWMLVFSLVVALAVSTFEHRTVQVRRGEPNARNEIRGSFARASRCGGYITRVLTRVMTPIHQDARDDRVLSGENECAARAWPELRTNVVARIF